MYLTRFYNAYSTGMIRVNGYIFIPLGDFNKRSFGFEILFVIVATEYKNLYLPCTYIRYSTLKIQPLKIILITPAVNTTKTTKYKIFIAQVTISKKTIQPNHLKYNYYIGGNVQTAKLNSCNYLCIRNSVRFISQQSTIWWCFIIIVRTQK